MSKSSGYKKSGSYTNPHSKNQHYKKQTKKFESMKYEENKKQKSETLNTYKKETTKKKPYKVVTDSMYGKVCKPIKNGNIKQISRTKKDSAKIFLNTDEFNTLCIELPVCMKPFHILSKQSKQLIINFINANNWVIPLLIQKIVVNDPSIAMIILDKKNRGEQSKVSFDRSSPFIKALFKRLLRHNFSNGKYYKHYEWCFKPRDVFFYRRKEENIKGGKSYHWYFCMNIADLYDCKAAFDKEFYNYIPYSLTINQLIYTNIKNNIESEYTYPLNSRLAILSTMSFAKYPISSYHKVKYVMYINNKHKFDKVKKEEEYCAGNFHKVVIKEIPLSTS